MHLNFANLLALLPPLSGSPRVHYILHRRGRRCQIVSRLGQYVSSDIPLYRLYSEAIIARLLDMTYPIPPGIFQKTFFPLPRQRKPPIMDVHSASRIKRARSPDVVAAAWVRLVCVLMILI